ncbi:MAG TPA: DmsE family decaheme c-type cytochrome [Bdellovibrionota bacterium]|nr:DmsE family decaheme c-type cytochrome [Bdellovibrionota bacterium]
MGRKIIWVLLFVSGFYLFFFGNSAFAEEIRCEMCHKDSVASFVSSHHFKAWEAKKDEASCSICHGGLDEHLKNPSKDTIISFRKDSKKTPEEKNKQCLSCHARNKEVAMWQTGIHKKNDLSCTSCHQMHKGREAAKPKVETCLSCHLDIKAKMRRNSHHPVKEGKLSCTDCHNPHGTVNKHNLIANGNEVCYKCHSEKRGPFIWEHDPVVENCNICHDVHGSRQPKLLVEKVPNLCQDCHDWSRHPGNAYDNTNQFAGTAPATQFIARSCLNCHSTIHGSYAPTNPSNTGNAGSRFVR